MKEINNIKPLIAIIGRPNVGKSTLFNAILGKNASIIDDMPGVTRDLHYEDMVYADKPFTLIDTGGFHIDEEGDLITQGIRKQIEEILSSVDGVILLADGKEGMHPSDDEIYRLIRKSGIRHWIAVTKIDGDDKEIFASEFYALGVDEIFSVSGTTAYGVYDFLDALTADFWTQKEIAANLPEPEDEIKIAVIGKPNVGKSTLVNKMIGSDRMLVSSIPGTTMDPIDSIFHYKEKKFRVIDTAGIRRKRGIDSVMENAAVVRAFRSIDRSDIVIYMMDASDPATEQDLRLIGLAHEKNKGVILVMNKWDSIEKNSKTFDEMVKELRYRIKFAPYAPVVSISALEGQRIDRLLDLVLKINDNYYKLVEKNDLDEWFIDSLRQNTPPQTSKHKPIRFKSAVMVQVAPPTIIIKTSHPREIHFSYQRYLMNRFYERFDYEGVPVKVIYKRG